MLSVFHIIIPDKMKVVSSDLITQIDKILPRNSSYTDADNFWLDDEINQDSIFIKFNGSEIHEIMIRFDTVRPNADFRMKIKEFINKNKFRLTIKQDITFKGDKLTDDLILLNTERWYNTGRPADLIRRQRSY